MSMFYIFYDEGLIFYLFFELTKTRSNPGHYVLVKLYAL